MAGFSDASFANNSDISSQLGHIIFLADISNSATPIYFDYYRSRHMTRSAMYAEAIAFRDRFNTAVALAQEFFKVISRRIPV